ncbi:NAD-P-binding protein [Mycena albidolilacea]|uniref:NAD-P-binding protein n=1 Tax=Mycena albidolilacea TaxID=1033008 RepID=A0AAD6Z1I8_9AGAR|nr:NAD-P-binding protein [Mycena albidolilacea]
MGRKSIREEDLVDLHGKVVLVTGGNAGIGYTTVQMLARKGAKVYMGARNGVRAAEAIERLKAENLGDGSVHWLEVDLSDPRLASQAAKEFLKREERLDILINNAGLQPNEHHFKLTHDGLLDIMVINYLTISLANRISPFVLTEALVPLMKRTAAEPGSDVRIVNVTSFRHTNVTPETLASKEALNFNLGDSMTAKVHTYGHTKLANILHIKALQTQFDAEGVRITCLAPHPGVIATPGVHRAIVAAPLGWLLARVVERLFFKSSRCGAMPVAFAAAGPEVVGPKHKEYKGAYLTPMDVIATSSKSAQDPRLQKELHETTERIVRELGL